jgi:hypothetical protein
MIKEVPNKYSCDVCGEVEIESLKYPPDFRKYQIQVSEPGYGMLHLAYIDVCKQCDSAVDKTNLSKKDKSIFRALWASIKKAYK